MPLKVTVFTVLNINKGFWSISKATTFTALDISNRFWTIPAELAEMVCIYHRGFICVVTKSLIVGHNIAVSRTTASNRPTASGSS